MTAPGRRASSWFQLASSARSAGTVEERATAMLEPLRREVPCAAAWIAVRDPETGRHRPVGRYGDTEAVARYFALPDADEELQQFGMNRRRPAARASDVPVPLPETLAWGEYLLPAGYRNGVAVGLFAEDGRGSATTPTGAWWKAVSPHPTGATPARR